MGAIGAVLIALLSLVMQVRGIFFAMPLLALAFGVGTAYTALFHQEAKDALGWKRTVSARGSRFELRKQ